MSLDKSFAGLFLGSASGTSPLCSVLLHLGTSIARIAIEAKTVRNSDPAIIEMYGPFLGRALLEASLTAITSRLDPFRILVLRQVQLAGSLDVTKPNKVSYRWQGDVVSDSKLEWSQERNPEQFSRALAGDCWDLLAWRKAFEKLLDQTSSEPQMGWVAEIRKIDPDTFIPRWRSELSKLYSTLSKGVHIEFVVPAAAQLGASSIQTALGDVVFRVAVLGAASHLIDHCAFSVSPEQARSMFLESEKDWQ